jgi:hypothetical protein
MNERIRQLALQAGIYKLDLSDETEYWIIEKFAELIVQDCLAQVDKVDTMLDDDKEKTGVAWVGLAIAKHFGVES